MIIKNSDYVLKDKKTTYIDSKVVIGKNVIIYENNRIEGCSVVDDNVTIFPNCYISNSFIGKGTKIYSSVVEKSNVGGCSLVGPYSHLKLTKLSDKTKVGAFCELKNCSFETSMSISSGTIMKNNEKSWNIIWFTFKKDG